MLQKHLTHWTLESEFPRIVVEHPIQNVDAAALAKRALHIADAVMGYLPE